MATRAKTILPDPAESAAMLDRARLTGQGTALLDYVQNGLRKKARRRKAAVKTGAATLGIIALVFWAIPFARHASTVTTPPAHRQQLTLADGTQAELNAHSALQTDFRYGRRMVHLNQGEAYFSVTKDAAHPFLVVVPVGTVRVTGTKFNVRLKADGTAVVTLYEGSVNIAPTSENSTAHLVPGEQAEVALNSAQVHALSAAQLDATIAWREGRIFLDGLTVAEAAARVGDYHGCKIYVAPAVADVRLGGSSSQDDLGQFFETLKAIGGLQVINLGNGSYQVTGR